VCNECYKTIFFFIRNSIYFNQSKKNSSDFRFLIGQYVTVHGEVVSHVNISRVEVEDGGLYACIVENRAGSTKHEGRLNIYGKI
jgi:hypothetical protein